MSTKVAEAATKRSLLLFDAAMVTYAAELTSDLLIKHHLDLLYDRVLETNLTKIIESKEPAWP
jgi:26S proteasome regulatory subunit N6